MSTFNNKVKFVVTSSVGTEAYDAGLNDGTVGLGVELRFPASVRTKVVLDSKPQGISGRDESSNLL